MPNVELLRKTLAHIEAHPEEWDQADWRRERSCGTSYCFAGWAVTLTGGEFYKDPDNGKVIGDLVVAPGGVEPSSIDEYAADLLDVYDEDEDCELYVPLFESNNTLDDLRRIVGELCGDES